MNNKATIGKISFGNDCGMIDHAAKTINNSTELAKKKKYDVLFFMPSKMFANGK